MRAVGGRGAAAAALSLGRASKPQAIDRVVDAITGLFGAGPTVSFAPVDGVFRAEVNVDAKATGLQPSKRVQAVSGDAPVRLYNRRGGAVFVSAPQLGGQLDSHG